VAARRHFDPDQGAGLILFKAACVEEGHFLLGTQNGNSSPFSAVGLKKLTGANVQRTGRNNKIGL
jgi:hypothetical protein